MISTRFVKLEAQESRGRGPERTMSGWLECGRCRAVKGSKQKGGNVAMQTLGFEKGDLEGANVTADQCLLDICPIWRTRVKPSLCTFRRCR